MANQDTLLAKMKETAVSYTPEWRFDPQNPDAGGVAALICLDMLKDCQGRYENVFRKHRIQYLNMFDTLKNEPVEKSTGYIQFIPVSGAPEPAVVRKGAQLFADSAQGRQLVFETADDAAITPAVFKAIYTADGGAEAITRQFPQDGADDTEQISFHAFHALPDKNNLSRHETYLGFLNAFDNLDSLDIHLSFKAREQETVLDALCGEYAHFFVLCEDGLCLMEKERTAEGIRLRADCRPVKGRLDGTDCYQIVIAARRLNELRDIRIEGLNAKVSGSNIIPDEVRCEGMAQNEQRFRPFGAPMEIYAACGIESAEVFARKGAMVNISFQLETEIYERLLPVYENMEELRIIMKMPQETLKPQIVNAYADYVVLEYLSETGWRRISKDDNDALIFKRMPEGPVTLSFFMPYDIMGAEAGEPRMRLRLARADNLYQTSCKQHCPVITGLHFSYEYAANPIQPDCVFTYNNFEEKNITQALLEDRAMPLFYTQFTGEDDSEPYTPTIYLGFDRPPVGRSPIGLYFTVENNNECPVSFGVQYHSANPKNGKLSVLRHTDETGGLLHSGGIRFAVPKDIEKETLFGTEAYWLRLVSNGRNPFVYNLPFIKGIYLNMVKIENKRSRTQFFYPDVSGDVSRIQLDAENIIDMKVYVNEKGSPGEIVPEGEAENWVQWAQARGREQEGRVYTGDMAEGLITFDKTVFAKYPVREGGAAVKVDFTTYNGQEANVAEGKVSALASSIPYIAGVKNPLATYGGFDRFNESSSARAINALLRTRCRAVTLRDYLDIIAQVSNQVRKIKCVSGININEEPQEDALTIAILIAEYEKGSHIFSSIQKDVARRLESCGSLLPSGRRLFLTQPCFVRVSARVWLENEKIENDYEVDKRCKKIIRDFIDPLNGGWEIGQLPLASQLAAHLSIKMRRDNIPVTNVVITAAYKGREYKVDDRIDAYIKSPFAMAVNGDHLITINGESAGG